MEVIKALPSPHPAPFAPPGVPAEGATRSHEHRAPKPAPFAAAMFLGAFLLFLVQPLAGKFLLPAFGGGAAVWTTCMLFFQATLLAGYAYAHLGISRLSPARQAAVHATVLLLAVGATWAAVPQALAGNFSPAVSASHSTTGPVLQILGMLAVGVGLPAVALSATSPLLNAWYGRGHAGGSGIYRLYAVSNIGSLLGLLGYPFVVEPLLTRRVQALLWAGAVTAFAALCAYCAWRAMRARPDFPDRDQGPNSQPDHGPAAGPPPQADVGRPPGMLRRQAGVILPACATVLLLATTNTLTQNVAAVPFLWVLPLALYLLTFVLAFAGWGYYPPITGPLLALAAAGVVWVLFQDSNRALLARAEILAAAMFVGCLVCHGELAALRPPPRYLTSYYLAIAAGGAGGGTLVALVAPLVLDRYVELHIGLWTCCLLGLLVPWARGRAAARADGVSAAPGAAAATATSARAAVLALGRLLGIAGLMVLGVLLWAAGTRYVSGSVVVHRSRDFYSVVTVYDTHLEFPQVSSRVLLHGSILHGLQFLDPDKRRLPTTYYGPESGINLAMNTLARPGARRVGVVGLGAGVMAAFAREGDDFRFYEISPRVTALAREQFWFLGDSPAPVETVLGDARVSLEREPPSRQFDVLVLDAFSSDAIPVHLLTAEAFALYRRRLAPGGLLCVQITNNHVDLQPVLRRHADDAGWAAVFISSPGGDARYASMPAEWVLMSDNDRAFAPLRDRPVPPAAPRDDPRLPRWTDEYASLLRVLR
jgi:SAM-dependent methyltransferase